MASLRGGVKYNTFLSRFKSVIISSNKAYYIPHLMGICSLLNSTSSNINSVNSSQSLPVIIPVCSLCVFIQLCYLSWRLARVFKCTQYVTGETFDVPGCCPNLSGLKVTCGLEVVLLTSALFNDQ